MSFPCEPVAAVNGGILPLRDACLSIFDEGVIRGATVTERIRTFRQQPYLLDEHLTRLRESLQATGIAEPQVVDGLPPVLHALLDHNRQLIADWQDLAIVVFVTPGIHSSLEGACSESASTPTVCAHTLPIPSPHWARHAQTGVRLITPRVRQPATGTIDPRIKHRSRLHWFLAERQVRGVDSDASPLLLDADGFVTETSHGNLLVYDGKCLQAPRPERVLGGISQRIVTEFAAAAGVSTLVSDMTPSDVIAGREAFLTSSGYCLLPVTQLNGRPIGSGEVGPLYGRLLSDWSAAVGVDILAQHQRAAAGGAGL